MKKKVSIIIPTYKRSDMLERAINSVLNQTYDNIELIVVDDNDSNSCHRQRNESLMLNYQKYNNVHYIKHKKNMNGSVARNTGIEFCNGDFIGFLDDDDEFVSTKIEKQVEILSEYGANVGAIYCGYSNIRGNKLLAQYSPEKQGNLAQELLLMQWGTGSGSNVLFKKEVFDEIQGFDANLSRHQDWDVLLRMFRKYEICFVNEYLLNIYKDSRLNIPNAEQFIDVKKRFFDKFSSDIDTYSDDVRKNIYQIHTLEICSAFLKNKKYLKALKCYQKSKTFREVSFRKKLSLILIIIYSLLPFKKFILVFFGNMIEKVRIIKV